MLDQSLIIPANVCCGTLATIPLTPFTWTDVTAVPPTPTPMLALHRAGLDGLISNDRWVTPAANTDIVNPSVAPASGNGGDKSKLFIPPAFMNTPSPGTPGSPSRKDSYWAPILHVPGLKE